jgi:hypothetical protein
MDTSQLVDFIRDAGIQGCLHPRMKAIIAAWERGEVTEDSRAAVWDEAAWAAGACQSSYVYTNSWSTQSAAARAAASAVCGDEEGVKYEVSLFRYYLNRE